jgi:hypothetical protein
LCRRALFQLVTRQIYVFSTRTAAKLYIRADSRDLPFLAPARVRFLQNDFIVYLHKNFLLPI